MSKLDDLLSKWPLPERTQLEADEAAERVVAAVRGGQLPGALSASLDDESLLAAPLPQTKDDNTSSRPGIAGPSIAVENKMSKDRTRDRTSFQELAKMATTPPPPTSSLIPSAPIPPSASSSGSSGVVRGKEADASDSGIVDLKAIANADPSGSQRAQSTPLAEQGLFDDDSAPAKPAVSAAAAQAHVSDAPSGSAKAALSTPPTDSKEEKKKGGGGVIVLGALVAAAAIAAGGFFFVKYQRTHNAQVATTTSTPDKAGQPAAVKAGATAGAIGSVAVADPQDDTVEIVTPGQPGVKPTFKFHAKAGGGGGAGGAATADPNAGGAGGVDPKLIANVPTGPAGGGGDLAEAMKAAAGGGSAMAGTPVTSGGTESKYAAGTVPQRPSQGSVAGGIGSVMPSVKSCLGSDDPISRASITFQSDGTVKSVTVSGFAAGKPQESCIKAALMKANVGPFAEATYQVTQPIRPN